MQYKDTDTAKERTGNMKATNTLSPASGKKQTFSAAIRGEQLQGLIRSAVANPEAAARLTGTLVSAVAATPQLQACNPASIVAAALRGEGMQLTYGMDYHLVPYGEKCTYILGYKGLLHLLIATGEVADTNCIPVLEGEYIGRNRKTKRPEFDFSVYETDEAEAGHPLIGYYFYVELKNGYTASEFMRLGEIINHAERYSQTFDRETYLKLTNGEFTPQEAERVMQKSPWYSATDTMMRKTVIRKLLNSGFVPLANSAALRKALDEDGQEGEGEIISSDILGGNDRDVVVVDDPSAAPDDKPGKKSRPKEADTTVPEPAPQEAEDPFQTVLG